MFFVGLEMESEAGVDCGAAGISASAPYFNSVDAEGSFLCSAIDVLVMLSHGLTSHRFLVGKRTIDVREILHAQG